MRHSENASVCSPERSATWIFEAALFILLFAFYAYPIQVPGPNELSRYDLVVSLLRDGTTVIDRYEVNTIDKATVGGRRLHSSIAFSISARSARTARSSRFTSPRFL